MAGRIDGATLHPWGEIPIDMGQEQSRERRKGKASGGATMPNKTASLRFLTIDEISTAPLYVVGDSRETYRDSEAAHTIL